MNFWKDESPFGLVTSLTLRCAHQDIQIIGSYWPCLKNSTIDPTATISKGPHYQMVAQWQQSFTPIRPGTP